MNKTSVDRIREASKFLRTPTAQAARGYLATPLELALKILDIFADGKPHFADEIAEATAIHPESVKQALRALEEGGYGLSFTPAYGWQIKRQVKPK